MDPILIPEPIPIPIPIPDTKLTFYARYGQPTRSGFSSFINSIFQFLPSFLWRTDNNKIQFPSTTIPTATSGVVRRQRSYPGNSSNAIVDDSGKDYVYDIDTCQTAYLVEKHADKSYEVTILYTKEVRPDWIEAKLLVILLRILIAEKNIPVLNNIFRMQGEWKIVGSIDCQRDRSYSVNTFHQDSLLSAFINNRYRPIFDDFLFNIFNPRQEYFSPTVFPGVSLGIAGNNPPESFGVVNYSTAHFGILDYDSIVSIIAAAVRTSTEYIFTILPPSSAAFRPFLFYLNSIISHATPSQFTQAEIAQIIAYYTQQGPLLPSELNNPALLLEALNRYNELFDRALEHPRNFRRLLGKILPTEAMRAATTGERNRDLSIMIEENFEKKKKKYGNMASEEKLRQIEEEKNQEIANLTTNATVENMTTKLKEKFFTNATYKYPEDEAKFKGIDQINTEIKRTPNVLKSDIFKELVRRLGLSPLYYTYASKTFTQEDVKRLKEENIETFRQDGRKRKVEEKKSETIISSGVEQIQVIRLPLILNKGGRSKTRQKRNKKRNTKKKYYFKKRRSSQKKNNKKRRSRKR